MVAISDRIKSSRYPSEVFRDGAKWLLVPAKVTLDGVCMWPENQFGFRKMVGFFYFICTVAILFGQISFSADQGTQDLVEFAQGLSFMFLSFEVILRRFLTYVYSDRLKKLIGEVCYNFWPSDLVGSKTHRELSRRSLYLVLYCSAYATFAFVGTLVWIIFPLSERNFPFFTKYTNKDKTSPYYELLYLVESISITEAVFNICGFDFLLCTLILNCAGQFRLLRNFARREFQDQNENRKEILRVIVIRHNKLISVCKELDSIYRNYVLIQYLANMAMICVTSFVTVVKPENLKNSLPLVFGHTCLTFLHSCMGENLNSESTHLSNVIYECNWHLWNTDNALKKNTMMIMIRAQKPIRLSIGGFGYLSLLSFMKLLQFSFSVFTFLYKFTNPQKANMLY